MSDLVIQQPIWTDADKKLIHQTVAQGTNESEFKLLLYTANKYELDPLVKQIWCVKYGNQPAAIYAGRDGFLHIAHKSGQFNGMETVALRDEKNILKGARCTVWRKDMTHPFIVEVDLKEYNTSKGNWAKMPETMIKKVAESQCLRKAFDISGMYSPEEMPEPQQQQEEVKPVVEVSKVTQNHISALMAIATKKGDTDEQIKEKIKNAYGIESKKDLTIEQFNKMMKAYEKLADVNG